MLQNLDFREQARTALQARADYAADPSSRRVFLYWAGPEPKLIKILRNLIYLHSTNGGGYEVHLLTPDNLHKYVQELPDCFDELKPAHQADVVRVWALHRYGGIWLDSDTLVQDSLDELFALNRTGDGFFIRENNEALCNGVFGSRAGTPLMARWKQEVCRVLRESRTKIGWTEVGSIILERLREESPSLFASYRLFNGLDNMYPVNWKQCVDAFLEQPASQYYTVERQFQPLIVLVNSVYNQLDHLTPQEILNGDTALGYLLRRAFTRLTHLTDLDFIEIGTSHFDTLISSCTDEQKGMSVEAVKYYVDCLPFKPNVRKIQKAISDHSGTLDVFYIPEHLIKKHQLPDWFAGCNKISEYHPLHIKHGVTDLVLRETVEVMSMADLLYQNEVRGVGLLKIDTEGHDCVIMKALHTYIQALPYAFYPQEIRFETNENADEKEVDEVLRLFRELGYAIKSKGYDTVLVHRPAKREPPSPSGPLLLKKVLEAQAY